MFHKTPECTVFYARNFAVVVVFTSFLSLSIFVFFLLIELVGKADHANKRNTVVQQKRRSQTECEWNEKKKRKKGNERGWASERDGEREDFTIDTGLPF